jgi:exonuclease III
MILNFQYIKMARDSFNFKLMLFNVRGLRCSKKIHSIFRFIKRKCIDVCLLQEAHCTVGDENKWKHEWGGEIYISHGVGIQEVS